MSKGHIYPLSVPLQKAMEEYISEVPTIDLPWRFKFLLRGKEGQGFETVH